MNTVNKKEMPIRFATEKTMKNYTDSMLYRYFSLCYNTATHFFTLSMSNYRIMVTTLPNSDNYFFPQDNFIHKNI